MKRLLMIGVIMAALTAADAPVSAQLSNGAKGGSVKVGENPVRYEGANAYSDGRGVWLEWKTAFESKNLGFYVYRVSGTERELVSPSLITGASLQAAGEKITSGSYSFYDCFGDENSVYAIESLNASGRKDFSNLIQTRFVNDLTESAGVSSEQLDAQVRSANPSVLGNDSVLPADLAREVEENTSPADPEKQRWVAAQPGVKIGVKARGFYRVARAELQASGFDTSAPAERWQLYANGVEQAINVGGAGDYIEFYGRGIETLDSETQIYFLVVGAQNGRRIGSAFRRRIGGTVVSESYAQSFYKKERQFYTSTILNGDAQNFFGTIVGAGGSIVSFNLSGVDFSSPHSSMDLTLQGATWVSHNVKVSINNVQVGTISGSNYASMTAHFDFPTSVLREGANNLQLKSLNASGGDLTAFDALRLDFARHYRAEQNRLSFHVPNYKASYVENFASPEIRVFDVTNPNAPVLISGLTVEPNAGSYRVALPSNRGRVMYAADNSGLSAPVSISRNFPSTLSAAANNGEMIILTHKNFAAPAEDWAVYRRNQGLTVKVVDIDDVYDEFNYGITKPDSIRDFLQYAKSNWQTQPNYVLLIGDATFDPKNYIGLGGNNFISTRLVDTIHSETGSDETLADFNDDGLAEIAIGRIPVRTAADAAMLLNKITNFEQTVGQASSRGAIFASDFPEGYDFEGLSNRLCQQLQTPVAVTCYKINRALPNANQMLIGEMNNGRYIVNYSGHGNAGVWGAGGFFSSAHAAELAHTNKSIYTMLTCLNGYFVQSTDSLSEVLLKNPNGGAVSAWASTGFTTPDVQGVMAIRFYNQLAAGNLTRIGDLVKDAKTTVSFGLDVRLSWALLGDPAMKVR